ncbi:MAG: hypothetical protein L3K08_08555, partial [Thermoplasmata archaeon]|nr:hypothetical protein [Thermoplasmata archaeon]
PGYIVATAGGYVSNETQVPDVPVDPSGVVDLGTVEMVPFGAVQLTVNFTGGTANGTWPSSLPPGGEGLLLIACALSGSDTGAPVFGGLLIAPSCSDTYVSVGVTAVAPVAPLRNILFLFREYGEPAGFPAAELTHLGGQPWPPWPYRFLNVTWANVTPDHVTNIGPLNIDAGTYLSGTVAISGSLANVTSAPVTVQVCSTVRAGECLPSVLTGSTGPLGTIPAGCPTAAYTFCAPAPPGPDELVASWGSIENSTWVTVPFGCCQQEGNPTDVGLLRLNVNVGAVHGTLGEEGQAAGVTPLSQRNRFVRLRPYPPCAVCGYRRQGGVCGARYRVRPST